MTDVKALVALAKEDFGMKRVNKAVESLIAAVELLAGGAPVEPAKATPEAPKQVLTEEAPPPPPAPPAETETTPADLARVLATQERSETEEPAPRAPRKRATNGTRSSDV